MRTIVVYERGDEVEYTGERDLPVRWQIKGTTREGDQIGLDVSSPMYEATVIMGVTIPQGKRGEVLSEESELIGFYPVRFDFEELEPSISVICLVNAESLALVEDLDSFEIEGHTGVYQTQNNDDENRRYHIIKKKP